LAGAAALLFPVDWPEPFGLVMIEAMACGTPSFHFDLARARGDRQRRHRLSWSMMKSRLFKR
jgi:glycosyltransferase involved in cell wall biosynthesis